MKERELRDAAKCGLCGKPFGHTGLPMFWRVTVERHALDPKAVQRQQGLGMMIGAPLAMVMGPGEEMTAPLLKPITITVCEDCATKTTCVASIAEQAEASVAPRQETA